MISLIIPTHNRLKMLQECLESVKQQTLQPQEIIIINDASEDGTKEYLLELGIKIKLINHDKKRGQSETRNSGIKIAKGDILVFLDDDCLPHQNWLLEIQKTFDQTTAEVVIGKTIYVAEKYQGYFPEKIVGNNNGKWPGAGNIAYKKSVLEKIGLFNPLFDQYHNEDSELGIRAIKMNTKFVQAPQAIVYHQKTFWNKHSLLASAKNPAVWVILKKLYPQHYNYFSSPIWQGRIIHPQDYLLILFLPLIWPILFVRYLGNGQKNLKIFFVKWPCLLFLRRYYIYKESWLQKFFLF